MKRIHHIILLIAALAAVTPVHADTQRNIRLSQHTLERMRAAQGDSVHSLFNSQMRAAVPAAQLAPMFAQLELQFGKLETVGQWSVDHIGQLEIYFCDLTFSRATLRMLTAFDPDGLMNTLRFVPAPQPAPTTEKATADTSLIRKRELTVTTGKYRLPATLTTPAHGNRFPCVVIVHGSGPQDRDGTMGPNHVYRDIAHGLAVRGIASLRYDKRTYVYRSTPADEPLTPDYETVDDALSAISLARTLPEVNPHKVIVAGHSFGGQMLPVITSRAGDSLAGAIVLSGAARHIFTLMDEQLHYLSPQADEETIKQQLAALKSSAPAEYWEYLDRYDTEKEAASMTLPVLVIQGGRDYQVTETDYAIWRNALQGNPKAQFRLYPDLNHIYQEGTAPSTPDEYSRPAPVSHRLLDDIAQWVLSL